MRGHLTPVLTAACAALFLMVAGPANADSTTASGTFTGASSHVTTGGVSVVETNDGSMVVILGEDFAFDGAPDPRVGLGKDGAYDEAADLGVLISESGTQTYVIPAGVDVSQYNEVYIWCRQYSVPLGVASVK